MWLGENGQTKSIKNVQKWDAEKNNIFKHEETYNKIHNVTIFLPCEVLTHSDIG